MTAAKLYDVAVIGGGSGGIGAAVAAARAGLDVILVEKEEMLGGTSTVCGVACWEPGVGGTGIPFEIYKRLKAISDAVGIYSFGRHFTWQKEFYWPHALEKVNFPGGETVIDPNCTYMDSLQRHVPPDEVLNEQYQRERWHGVIFEPQALSDVAFEMLAETGRCETRLSTRLVNVQAEERRVVSGQLNTGEELAAELWIDATGDGSLSMDCGCASLVGKDSKAVFNEAGAPEEGHAGGVNGVSLLFRATPAGSPRIEPLPEGIPDVCWWATAFPPVKCDHFPNGDLMINMLPTMSGTEYLEHVCATDAYTECERRVVAEWHFLQSKFPEFRNFRLHSVSKALGVRESRRIVCDRMLTEHDLLAGLSGQDHTGIVAIADHPFDRHDPSGGGCRHLQEPYGIYYQCLIPKAFRNLLVSCRCAGFSSLAAASCRLSRTMMQLGQAAGTAAGLAIELGVDLPDVPADQLRSRLRAQHAQLDWPTPPELEEYLSRE